MTALLRLGRLSYLRYGLASGLALAFDVALFSLLVALGVPVSSAAALGYGGGVVVHWIVSSRYVFAAEAGAEGSARRGVQKALFAASAAVGLGMTALAAELATRFGADPWLAKALAVAASFQSVWLLRRHLVFSGVGAA